MVDCLFRATTHLGRVSAVNEEQLGGAVLGLVRPLQRGGVREEYELGGDIMNGGRGGRHTVTPARRRYARDPTP